MATPLVANPNVFMSPLQLTLTVLVSDSLSIDESVDYSLEKRYKTWLVVQFQSNTLSIYSVDLMIIILSYVCYHLFHVLIIGGGFMFQVLPSGCSRKLLAVLIMYCVFFSFLSFPLFFWRFILLKGVFFPLHCRPALAQGALLDFPLSLRSWLRSWP